MDARRSQPTAQLLATLRGGSFGSDSRSGSAADGNPLVNVAARLPQEDRYTSRYSGGVSLIDHLLVFECLFALVAALQIDRSSVKDHWPRVVTLSGAAGASQGLQTTAAAMAARSAAAVYTAQRVHGCCRHDMLALLLHGLELITVHCHFYMSSIAKRCKKDCLYTSVVTAVLHDCDCSASATPRALAKKPANLPVPRAHAFNLD